MANETERERIADALETNGDAEQVTSVIDHLLDQLGSHVAFGSPITVDDTTVIPVADVRTGFGFGFGHGRKGASDEESSIEEGGGSGSGGAGRVTPLGYIRITPNDVSFDRIYDTTKIALAGMALAGWGIFVIDRLLRR